MKTINKNSTGNQFIQDLNDNFAECGSGQSTGTGNVSVSIPLQGGELKAATGYVDGRWCEAGASNGVGTWTDDNYYKYLHTPCYLSLARNQVKAISTPNGSTLSIFCYDENCVLLGNGKVSSVASIPSGTSYVKFMVYNSNGYSSEIALDVTLASRPVCVKNTAAGYVQQFFNFDCRPPKIWDDAACTIVHEAATGDSADVDSARYHDNGCIILPPNYSATGTPCKVIIWFNGDNCANFIMHDCFHQANGSTSVYEANYKYLLANGYAIAMCSGYTSMWKAEQGATQSSLWVARISPAYIASTKALYEFLMRNYNLEPEVYLGAKSAGGSMMLYTALTKPFPVRAAAGISLLVSTLDMMRMSLVGTLRTWAKRMGCPNWSQFVLSSSGSGATATLVHNASGASNSQQGDAARLLVVKDIIRKYDAFGISSNIDWDSFVEQCLSFTTPFANAEYPQALTDVIYGATKYRGAPIKLWCATLDQSVPYGWHKVLVELIKKNGGLAEMRTYAGSDGSHAILCGQGNKTATVGTRYGGSRTAGIGIVESVEWYNRF